MPSDFCSLSSLLDADGLIAKKLSPAPSRRSLLRSFKAARIPRWKCNGTGAAKRGGGEAFFQRLSVEAWLARNTWTGANE